MDNQTVITPESAQPAPEQNEEIKKPKKKRRELWIISLLKFIAYFGVYFTITNGFAIVYAAVASAVISAIYMSNYGIDELIQMSMDHVMYVQNYIGFAAAVLTFIIFVVFFLIRRKNPIREMGLIPRKAWLLPVALITGVALNFVLSLLFELIPPELLEQYSEAMGDLGPLSGMVLMVVLGAPFIEEIIFRGLGISRLKRSMPTWLALILSTLFFGLAHFGGHWLQVIYTGIFGLILGALYCRTGSVWLSIALHLGFNAANLLAYVDPEKLSAPMLTVLEFAMTLITFLSVPAAILGVVLLLVFTRGKIVNNEENAKADDGDENDDAVVISAPGAVVEVTDHETVNADTETVGAEQSAPENDITENGENQGGQSST